jgi:hypothetical protein
MTLPTSQVVVRGDEAFVELRHAGGVVGEINVSKILRHLFTRAGWLRADPPGQRMLP